MFFVNILTQRKTGVEPAPGEDSRLFGIYDSEVILRTVQTEVAEIAIDIKMVGVRHGINKGLFPRPIELGQTISIKSGDSFLRWKMDSQEFPEDLVNRTWALSYTSAKNQVTEANTHIKTNKLIQPKKNMGGVRCLIVLCSTSYESLEKLNRHIDTVHTGEGGLSYLPECQPVDGSTSTTRAAPLAAAAGPAATACGGHNTNRTPNGISNLLRDKENLIKTVKTDSVPQVSDKLTSVLNKMDTEFYMFDTNGFVRSAQWGNLVRVLEVFLTSSPDAFPQLKSVARAATGDPDVFQPNNQIPPSRQQLKKWVAEAWDQVSDLTELRRLARVVTEVKPTAAATSTVRVYDEALTQVRALLGKEFEVMMPVTLSNEEVQVRGKVNMTYFLANLLTVARFNDSEPKIWTLAKSAQLRESLFPRLPGGPE